MDLRTEFNNYTLIRSRTLDIMRLNRLKYESSIVSEVNISQRIRTNNICNATALPTRGQ